MQPNKTIMIDKERLIYSNKPFTKYRWISYVSFIQAGFVALNLVFLPTPKLLEQRQKSQTRQDNLEQEFVPEETLERKPDGVWARLKNLNYGELFSLQSVYSNIVERPYLCLGVFGASAMVISFSVFYTRRLAHQITLLPNDRVRFASFSPLGLGRPPSIELPLKNVSCVAGRHSDKNYSILKFKGYFGYHLVNKKEGDFIEPDLYDKYLGYERSWAKKS